MKRRAMLVGAVVLGLVMFPLHADVAHANDVIHVTDPADNGAEGSLRWAIFVANGTPGPDVVSLDAVGPYDLTICALGELFSTEQLEVRGNGNTVQQLCADYRVLSHDTTQPLALLDVTLTGGFSSDVGGNVYAGGDVVMTDAHLRGGIAILAGGGAYVTGTLTMVRSSLDQNLCGAGIASKADPLSASWGGGGALVRGDVSLTDSDVTANQCAAAGAGLMAEGALDASSSHITGNTPFADVPINGGGFYAADTDVTGIRIADTEIADNAAGTGGGGVALGLLDVSGGSVERNEAVTGDAGGLLAFDGSVRQVMVRGNKAADSGGGLWFFGDVNLDHATLSDNEATSSGGGVLAHGTGTVVGTTVSGNRARDGAGLYVGRPGSEDCTNEHRLDLEQSALTGNVAARAGGGAWVGCTNDTAAFGDLKVRDTTVSANTAGPTDINGFGGGVLAFGGMDIAKTIVAGNHAHSGGGLVAGKNVDLVDSRVEGNVAEEFAGGISDLNLFADLDNPYRMSLIRSSVSGNRAVNGFGGGITSSGISLELNESELVDNQALGAGGASITSCGRPDDPNACPQIEGTILVIKSTVSRNRATKFQHGGLIAGENLILVDSELSSNTAADNGGGGVAFKNVDVSGSIVRGNVAGGLAGGVSSLIGNVSVRDSTVVGNRARVGGGIMAGGEDHPSLLTLLNVTLAGNVGTESVGGAFVAGELDMDFTTVAGNVAPKVAQLGQMKPAAPNRPSRFESFASVVTDSGGSTSCQHDAPATGEHNAFADASCGTSVVTGDPALGALGAHGGPNQVAGAPMPVLKPAADSPLIDAVPLSHRGCAGTDERGFTRPSGGGCDIGAVELQAPTMSTPAAMTTPENTPVSFDASVLVIDDPDDVFQGAFAIGRAQNGGGVSTAGSVVTYTPTPAFFGDDAFDLRACNATLTLCSASELAVVTVLAAGQSSPTTTAPPIEQPATEQVVPAFAG